jgi:primosomal protein N' (replication factor Y)
LSGDYTGFAKSELDIRKALQYPPFSFILRLIAATNSLQSSTDLLASLRTFLENQYAPGLEGITLLGPAPCPIERIKTRFRAHMLIKADKLPRLIKLQHTLKQYIPEKGDRLLFDLNPIDLL